MDQNAVPVVLHYQGGITESVMALPTLEVGGETVLIIQSSGERKRVPLGELKAIFYLRLGGSAEPERPPDGKLLSVEFQDGEVIRGISREYSPERNGFFLFPLDRSKNDVIFVVNAAIHSIEVEKF